MSEEYPICPIWNMECPKECMSSRNIIPSHLSPQLAECQGVQCLRSGVFFHRPLAFVSDMTADLDEDAILCLRAEIAYQNEVYKTAPILDKALIRKIKFNPYR